MAEISENMMTNGYTGPPIDVVEYDGQLFVVDGHHRLAAAKMAGIKMVPVRIIDDIASHPSSWMSIEDVIQDANSVPPNNLRKKGQRLPY